MAGRMKQYKKLAMALPLVSTSIGDDEKPYFTALKEALRLGYRPSSFVDSMVLVDDFAKRYDDAAASALDRDDTKLLAAIKFVNWQMRNLRRIVPPLCFRPHIDGHRLLFPSQSEGLRSRAVYIAETIERRIEVSGSGDTLKVGVWSKMIVDEIKAKGVAV